LTDVKRLLLVANDSEVVLLTNPYLQIVSQVAASAVWPPLSEPRSHQEFEVLTLLEVFPLLEQLVVFLLTHVAAMTWRD